MERKGLINLGYSGPRFTWQHGVNALTRKVARLDIALCDVEWQRHFHSANIKHLPHAYSDHCPLSLSLDAGDGDRLGDRPFRFLAPWLRHEEFDSWMKREWNWQGDLGSSLKELEAKLKAWNRDTFGNIFRRKQ